jgi:hypothetical protein
MKIIDGRITIAILLNLEPWAFLVLSRYGLHSLDQPEVAYATLQELSQIYKFDLNALIEELNSLSNF